ncbi:MAG: sigma-E processing peptidase SpoIIGA [Bacillota bacterium]|jgi:stage II sporulation protein GA (sporulation sigma-E factor processing peptidase)
MDVYVDLLFLVNLGLNGWALWLSSSLIGQKLSWQRWLLSSALGAVYGLGIVTPWATFFSHPGCKLVLAGWMVQIAFQPSLVWRLLRLSGLFILVSCLTAGCVLGVQTLLGGGFPGGSLAYGGLPLWVLPAAVLVTGLTSKRMINLLENRLVHVTNQASISFSLNGTETSLNGLVDSGNQLVEPFAGRPVVIISLEAVAHLLPDDVVTLIASGSLQPEALNNLAAQPWVARLRFIPYHSVGRRSGVLLGWRVDRATITVGSAVNTAENVVLAIADHSLHEQGAYQALIPERLLPVVNQTTQEVLG